MKSVPAFGSMPAIDPARFMLLPPAMQGEGVRMMLEHGATHFQVARHLGLRGREVMNLAEWGKPFQRGGEVIREGED